MNYQFFKLTKNLQRIFFLSLCLAFFGNAKAQKKQPIFQDIFFHLYTDSLKKGTHNYINVDGKTAEGKWLPLTETELKFTADLGVFNGNELILPANLKEGKITITVILKSNPTLTKTITIGVKQLPDPELPKWNMKYDKFGLSGF